MPTKIARLGRERTVATLARRLYRIEGRGSTELQRRAEAALIAANPRLASADGFRSGDAVVVPAVPGLRRTDEVSAAAVDREGLRTETALRLEALGSRIEDRFRRAAENRWSTLERLDDSKFVAEARAALPESTDAIAEARKRLANDEQQDAERSERLRKAVATALASLGALDKIAR